MGGRLGRATLVAVLVAVAAALADSGPSAARGVAPAAASAAPRPPRVLFLEPANLLRDLRAVGLLDPFLAGMQRRLAVSPRRFGAAFARARKALRADPVLSYADRPGGRAAIRAALLRDLAGRLGVSPARLARALDARLRRDFRRSLDQLASSGQLSRAERAWFLGLFDEQARWTMALLRL